MTDDDGFVFDEADEHDDDDETALFGTSSDESAEKTANERHFGTTTSDSTDSQSLIRRVRDAVSGSSARTAATAGLAVVLVVALGLVVYPLVIGTFDAAGPADAPAADSTGIETHATAPNGSLATTVATTVQTDVSTTTVPTKTTTLTGSTTRKTPNATPTPTPTPIPTREFPAGTPVETNETADARRARPPVQSAA